MGDFITNDLTNGTLADGTEVERNLADVQWRPICNKGTENIYGMIAHSSSNWSVHNTSFGLKITTDGGNSWATAAGTHALDVASFIRVCDADTTKGIAIEGTGDNEGAYTSDSGATWNAIATSATFTSNIYDVSFPTSALIVVAGDDGGGANHIIYSADSGATWNNAGTSPGALVYCVSMFDATTGYAVDSAGNIWKTSDGAVTWVDTTDDVPSVSRLMSAKAITADIVIFNRLGGSSDVTKYVNSTNTVTNVLDYGASSFNDVNLGLLKTANGNVFCAMADTANTDSIWVFRSTDNGDTWSMTQVGQEQAFSGDDVEKCMLAHYSNNLLVPSGSSPMIIRLYGGTSNT
jgi:photosystem II stability/assembly factor-like uncharacterized protein